MCACWRSVEPFSGVVACSQTGLVGFLTLEGLSGSSDPYGIAWLYPCAFHLADASKLISLPTTRKHPVRNSEDRSGFGNRLLPRLRLCLRFNLVFCVVVGRIMVLAMFMIPNYASCGHHSNARFPVRTLMPWPCGPFLVPVVLMTLTVIPYMVSQFGIPSPVSLSNHRAR